MSDIKLLRVTSSGADEIAPHFAPLEKDIQNLMEKRLEPILNIRFLASEYSTGKNQRGVIDTLGLDENCCPVIIEYKRRYHDNIINQGLFYLDWLLDHRGDFIVLVQKRLGIEAAANIDFSCVRLLCVAADFSRFDEAAAKQIGRNLELIKYRLFGEDLLLLEKINSDITPFIDLENETEGLETACVGMSTQMRLRLKSMNENAEKIYLELLTFAENLGEDITVRFLKHYVALARARNFTSIQPYRSVIKIYLNLDPDEFLPEDGFGRDVRAIGHHGSGNLQIDLRTSEDLQKAKPLIEMAYLKN